MLDLMLSFGQVDEYHASFLNGAEVEHRQSQRDMMRERAEQLELLVTIQNFADLIDEFFSRFNISLSNYDAYVLQFYNSLEERYSSLANPCDLPMPPFGIMGLHFGLMMLEGQLQLYKLPLEGTPSSSGTPPNQPNLPGNFEPRNRGKPENLSDLSTDEDSSSED